MPGAWDGFELAVRAVLGQQITVSAARRLAGTLVATYGAPAANADDERFSRVFPRPQRLAAANLARSACRAHARLRSRHWRQRPQPTRGSSTPRRRSRQAIARLRALPGIGEWTAQYVALRALRETDAFPAADTGLLRAAERVGATATPTALLARAEAWRPWRAYAAQHLWTADAEPAWPARGGGLWLRHCDCSSTAHGRRSASS